MIARPCQRLVNPRALPWQQLKSSNDGDARWFPSK